jgi:hypothetical protein
MDGQVLLVKPVSVLHVHQLEVREQINRHIWDNRRIKTDKITPKMSMSRGRSSARVA